MPKTYAVVDLETTGTKMDGKERIIQFSCVFVENNRIVNQFDTLVNPLKEVPRDVQELTGISTKKLRKAPIFEDIAGTIYALLQDTIFVAHNIQFDLRFLNLELERVGYPALQIPGIDTVQLSEVLFPCLNSYRLQDIANELKIKHSHPHQADSDTLVTAKLFIKLNEQIDLLPRNLFDQLVKMSDAMIYETGELFKDAKPKDIDEDQYLNIGKITLKKWYYNDCQNMDFLEKLNVRKVQKKLMSDVFDFFDQKNQQHMCFLEAPTGIGKTLGYLIPIIAKNIQTKQKFVVSTSSINLQNQIINTEIPKFKLDSVIKISSIKGSSHYIDLDKFSHSLERQQNSTTIVLQMRILVWLSQTLTGDLDELRITTQQIPLFDEIRHQGIQSLNEKSRYYRFDFVRQAVLNSQNADLVITNHSFLMQHADEFESSQRILILDEAQQIPEITTHSNKATLDFDEVKILADTLLVKLESQASFSFRELAKKGLISKKQYQNILKNVRIIDTLVSDIRDLLFNIFCKKQQRRNNYEIPIKYDQLFGFFKEHVNLWKKVDSAKDFLEHVNLSLYQKLVRLLNDKRLDNQSFGIFKSYLKISDQLLKSLSNWKRLSLDVIEKMRTQGLVWISLASHENAHLRMNFGLFKIANYLEENIYRYFDKVLFFSGNHFSDETYLFISKQLFGKSKVKHLKYDNIFDYTDRSELLAVCDAPDITTITNDQYVDYLVKMICEICDSQKRQTMVLFNSLEMIQKVYEKLQDTKIDEEWEILAQGISGTTEKIKKKFVNDNASKILLATGSFWEGIDFPGTQLETLVIARLPFKAIQSPYNQIRYRKAEQNGENSFLKLALPEAVMKFTQGVGRLIRTMNDIGIIVVLDSRIVSKNYGSSFLDILPKGMPIKKIERSMVKEEVHSFFTEKEMKSNTTHED